MGEVRVDLKPAGRATLVATAGWIEIDAPASLEQPWVIPLDVLAAVVWRSPHGAAFDALGLAGPATADEAPFTLGGRTGDVRLAFTKPCAVPLRRWRSMLGAADVRDAVSGNDLRALWPPAEVRTGLATSLVLDAATDARALKAALEHAGIEFARYGAGPAH